MVGNWVPSLSSPWSPSDLDEVLGDALRILGEIGVECAHAGVRARLAGWDGASVAGERVRFAPSRVRDHLEARRTPSPEPSDGPAPGFSLGGCWAGLNYCDPETLDVRPATSEEAAQMARLWDARGLSGVVPLMPGDVPAGLVTLAAERIALTNARYLGGTLTVTDPEEVRYLIDMNLAAGRRYSLMEQVGISPLRFDALGLEAALPFLGRTDVEVILSGFIPMAGVTCPLDPPSAVAQSTAETIAHDILCAVLDTGGDGLGIRVEPFDFQYSMIVFGSPEWCLYRTLVLQMNEHLTGQRVQSGRFRCMAKRPNAQAACERTASALWQALLGARHFGAVGQLSVDEVFSPQQAVLDGEILSYVERVMAGIDLRPGPDAVQLVRQGIAEGNFVGVDDTVARYRDFYRFPALFRHWNVGRWRAEGEPAILAEAWARARTEIASSTFALADEQQRKVERIYAKARDYVRG